MASNQWRYIEGVERTGRGGGVYQRSVGRGDCGLGEELRTVCLGG